MSPTAPAPVAPVPDASLEQALEHARFVQELGVDGAPGAAHLLALVLPELVIELRALRMVSGGAGATLAMSEQLWKDRALRAEQRCGVLAVDARQLPRVRAASEELLTQLADERGTREALDRLVAQLKAEVAHLKGQIDGLADVLMREHGGPDRSESACEMAARVLREQRAAIESERSEFNAETLGLERRVAELELQLRQSLDPLVRQKMLESPPPIPLTADAEELLRLRARVAELEGVKGAAA